MHKSGRNNYERVSSKASNDYGAIKDPRFRTNTFNKHHDFQLIASFDRV